MRLLYLYGYVILALVMLLSVLGDNMIWYVFFALFGRSRGVSSKLMSGDTDVNQPTTQCLVRSLGKGLGEAAFNYFNVL